MYLCPRCDCFIEDEELENTDFNCPYCANSQILKCKDIISNDHLNYSPDKKFIEQFEKEYGVAFDENNLEHCWIKKSYFSALKNLKEIEVFQQYKDIYVHKPVLDRD